MTETKYIQGAGGGGGKGGGGGSRTPTEADDTLQSVQFASVLDLISEGEIAGIEDPGTGTNSWQQNVYLDNTPVKNSNNSDNFSGFSIIVKHGTQTQDPIVLEPPDRPEDDPDQVKDVTAVGVEVKKGAPGPVIRTIDVTNVDRIRVTLGLRSGLQKIDDNGDILGHEVKVKIQMDSGGGYVDQISEDIITGKSSGAYQRDYLITVPTADGNGNPITSVDLKVERLSDDETSSKKVSTITWISFTTISDDKFTYPNSAVVGLRFDARQFSSVPSRKYLIRGIKVAIPSNATVDLTEHPGRITYSGVWDGTFKSATWTNDPAWCLYDLLTSTRYGAGVPADSLDKYDFFAISQYCNELVDNGRTGAQAGSEPRFSLNMLLNSRAEVYSVIQEMTAVFRGIAYYGAGSLVLNQDKPTDSSYVLGPSNVVDGVFEYTGTSQKARHTVATVAYQNYDTQGDTEFEYVEDVDAVAKYGIINKDIKAIGCYSQGQAHRIGKWTLLSEQNLTETCQFAVGIESGIVLRPGMVVDIADPVRAGVRRSGRVRSATSIQLTVDSSTNLSISLATATNDPKVSVMLPSGIAETRNIPAGGIQPQANGTATIDVTSAFSQIPTAGSVFLIQTSDIQSQQFRVISVAETEDGVYGVSALAYNASIYDAVESDNELTRRDITNLSAVPDPVSSIEFKEFLYVSGQNVLVGVDVSWSHSRVNVSEFRVQYRIDNDNFETLTTASPSITIRDVRAGTLTVQIQARNYLNRGSTPVIHSDDLEGRSAKPQLNNDEFLADGTTPNPDYVNFDMIPVNGQAKLTWRQSLDVDVRTGGHVRLRHSPSTSNVTWSTSTSISEEIAGSATEAYADLKSGTYSMKFVDSGGRESTNFALIEYIKPELESTEEVSALSATEDPTFPGTKTNLSVDSSDQELELALNGSVQELSGEYLFSGNPYTLTHVGSLRLESTLKARGYFPGTNLFDDILVNIDELDDFDGPTPDKCDVKLYVRTTNDDPSASPTWTSWRHFNNAEIKCRAFELKAEFENESDKSQISVEELRVKALMPYRTLSGEVTTSTSGDTTVSFGTGNRFYVKPSIGIIFASTNTTDYYEITNDASGSSFDISVYNGSDQRIAKTVRWNAVGYGRG